MAVKKTLDRMNDEDRKSGIKHNPEVDAKLDKFIADNPDLYAKINAYSREDLVRKRMLDIMNQNERRQGYREEIRQFVELNPEVKQEVEKRLNRIPESQRENAFVRVARSVAANLGMSQKSAPSISPS